MKYLIQFGLASIWCIFSSGCHSNHSNHQNLEKYYLGKYVDNTITSIQYTKFYNYNRANAKKAEMEAQRNWRLYIKSRHSD